MKKQSVRKRPQPGAPRRSTVAKPPVQTVPALPVHVKRAIGYAIIATAAILGFVLVNWLVGVGLIIFGVVRFAFLLRHRAQEQQKNPS